MTTPAWILTGIAIVAPWLAALLVCTYARHARRIGFGAALVSAIACALLLRAAPAGESL